MWKISKYSKIALANSSRVPNAGVEHLGLHPTSERLDHSVEASIDRNPVNLRNILLAVKLGDYRLLPRPK